MSPSEILHRRAIYRAECAAIRHSLVGKAAGIVKLAIFNRNIGDRCAKGESIADPVIGIEFNAFLLHILRRSPLAQRPWLRVMLVAVQVSSMNTRRSGSRSS